MPITPLADPAQARDKATFEPPFMPIANTLSLAASTHWELGRAWIIDNLDAFLPTDLRDPDSIKEITELSLFYGISFSWLDIDCRLSLEPVRDFLLEFVGDPFLVHWVRRRPTLYSPYMLLYAAFRGLGLRLPEFEQALRVLHGANYPRAIEKIPYREMEIAHALWKAGLRKQRPGWTGAYRRTTLGRAPNPAYLSIPEVYSVTHTLFYVTDFSGPRPEMPAADREKALALVEPLLVHYWRKRDWDITGELLLNLVALDKMDTALFRAAFRALLSVRRADGTLPGPHLIAADIDEKSIVNFRHCYHTTLIGMMLCSAYLYRARQNVECVDA